MPLCQTYFLIPFGMKEKMAFFELCFTCTDVKSIVSQLSKCLKFKSIRGDKNDCILYKITPRNVTNFRHLLSCDTIDIWNFNSCTLL